MMGKGSKRRPSGVSNREFSSRWDLVFKRKDRSEKKQADKH